MSPKTKAKIKAIHKSYKEMFPDEYKLICEYIKALREGTVTDYAESEEESAFERKLGETPETLITMIEKTLSEEEMKEFRGVDKDSMIKSARWFYKTFNEFAVAKKI